MTAGASRALVALVAILLPAPANSWTTWQNGFEGSGSLSCGSAAIIGMRSVHAFDGNDIYGESKDRKWAFDCASVGFGSTSSTYPSGSLNGENEDFDFACPENYFIYRWESDYHGNSKHDREYQFDCREIRGATLEQCHSGPFMNDYEDFFTYVVDPGKVISGISSSNHDDTDDRKFRPYTCKIECDKDQGLALDGYKCIRQRCGELKLANGTVSGDCDGAYGDKCTYSSCKTGFELSSVGEKTRECGWQGNEVVWLGMAKSCDDINECRNDEDDCPNGAICHNTIGSYTCTCVYGELTEAGDECYVPQPTNSMWVYSSQISVQVNGEWTETFPKYKLYIGKWGYDLSSHEAGEGYPKIVDGPLDSRIYFNGLEPGSRYRIEILPMHDEDEELPHYNYIAYRSIDQDPQTPCGCSGHSSGAPTEFEARQFKGHVLFKWRDQCLCESAFTFTRNGIGLSARFDVTEQSACGAVQEPLSVYDDLTIQAASDYAEEAASNRYKLPDGSFYFKMYESLQTGETRFKYPEELQSDGYFSSSSTTTTAAPANLGEEDRYYPGTSTAVQSVGECKTLCDSRSSWCLGFAVETTENDELICHQLRVLEERGLRRQEKKSVSYQRVEVAGSGVSGGYIFEGSMEDCEEACDDQGNCVMAFVGRGYCGYMSSIVSTDVADLKSIHPKLQPDFSRRIPGPEPGISQQYCITATNPTWYDPKGYSSGTECTDFTIDWESYVEGQVTIDSDEIHLPVEGVEIEYEIGPVRGKRVTNDDGKFYIHVLSNQLRRKRQHMTVRFSKVTGNIRHTFSCGGVACTEHTFIMEHLRFDHHVHIRDTTSLPFSGIVSIGGTEHEGLPDGCPLKGVEVCLRDRLQGEKLINCDLTDAKGRYLVRAVMGASVYVDLQFGNTSHTFERTPYNRDAANAPTGLEQTIDAENNLVRTPYYDITEGKFWENINFKDVSSDTATVDIAGGKCNFVLGDAVIEFRYDSCPTWVQSQTISERLSVWKLPAQIITVRFKEITRNFEVRGEITRYFSATLGNSRSLHIDLREHETEEVDGEKTVRFEYHPPPTLAVSFSKELKHNCNNTEGTRPRHVMNMQEEMTATVTVVEDFGDDIGICDSVPGIIEIENQLGESPATVDGLNKTSALTDKQLNKLEACYRPCEMDVVRDEQQVDGATVYSNTRVELDMMTGGPETNPEALDPENPYTKLFRATMHNLPHDPVSVYEKVVVVGDKVISEFFSVPFPRYKPLTVVQDPPGGLSTVSYSKVYNTFKVRSKTHEQFHGFYLGVELGLGLSSETFTCAGALVAMVCIETVEFETTQMLNGGYETNFLRKPAEENYESESSWAFAIDLATSDDPELAGLKSDMFLVPALNVIWMETDEVSFDFDACTASKETKVKWALGAKENEEVLSWISHFDITDKEIPALKNLLQQARENPDPDETEEDQQEKINELQKAIAAWEANVDRNEQIRQQAGDGVLQPIQTLWRDGGGEFQCIKNPFVAPTDPTKAGDIGNQANLEKCNIDDASNIKDVVNKGMALAPHDLIDTATNLDGSGASDEQLQALREINAIKFSGGGSTYTFTLEKAEAHSAVSGNGRTEAAEAGYGSEYEIDAGASILVNFDAGYQYEGEFITETERGAEQESAIEVTLGDPDQWDVFDVQMFVHPDYGTLVFHTMSGRSSCPNEPNTVVLYRPGISVLKRPEAPVLPNEPAVFELLLKHDGEVYADLELFSVNNENQDGLTILADGQSLSQPAVYETFYPGARHVTVLVTRGPSKYKYDPVPIGWRSPCERSDLTAYVYLEAEFLQPCSPVRLAGETGETGEFAVNSELMQKQYRPGEVRIVAFNPDFAERTWLEDDRLEEVVVEFKPKNSHVWLLARDKNGDALDIRIRENEYGYVTAWWDASTLLAGAYHLRIRAQCTASINDMPDGIDEKFSITASGVVDRDPPVIFGFPEPADGDYFPGDEIAFQFDEPVECRQPFIFQVSLTVQNYDRDFNNNNMVIVCEGRKISMALRSGFKYDDVNGKEARVVIENVKDLNDNPMESNPEHTFTFAELNLEDASASVSGLRLGVSYEDAYRDTESTEYAEFKAELEAEIAGLVDVQPYRVTITAVNPIDADDYSAGVTVTVRFEAATTAAPKDIQRRALDPSATDLADLLETQLQNETLVQAQPIMSQKLPETELGVEVEPSTADVQKEATKDSSTWSDYKLDSSLALNACIFVLCIIILVRTGKTVPIPKLKSSPSRRRSSKVQPVDFPMPSKERTSPMKTMPESDV